MKVAFQMDENINFKTDTTFALIKEAQRRKHEIFFYIPNNLALKINQPIAIAQKIIVDDFGFVSKKEILIDLSEMDIIFIRQNPPFDMRYITTTYILERITNSLVINNPVELRNCPEKLITSLFKELTPPTIITENIQMIKNFHHLYEDIILKPLYSYGGNDVIRIQDKKNIQVVAELMIAKYNCPIVVQVFCKNIDKDKRILLLDGEPIGIIKRVPKDGEIRTNLRLGAKFENTQMSDRDNEICYKIGPELKKRGLIFVGIDIIDNFLLEINITSPTGLVYINKLYNKFLEKELWDKFEEKVKK